MAGDATAQLGLPRKANFPNGAALSPDQQEVSRDLHPLRIDPSRCVSVQAAREMWQVLKRESQQEPPRDGERF